MSQNNKAKAVKSVAWSAIEKFSVQFVQFVVSIILARLLSPNAFGIVAIVLVFTTIFQTINESGFNTALIYKQDRDDLDYSTAFVANLVIGIISYLILYLIAPWIASFYKEPSLALVMRLSSLVLPIRSVGLVPLAIFTIRLDFKIQARASLTSAIISGIIGVASAYFLENVYAIIIQQLVQSIIYVFLLCIYARYIPSFNFSRSRFLEIWNYAYKLICARLISVVFEDIYSLAIGKLYTPAVLGCYNRAMSFRQVLSKNIINVVQRVSVPLMCEEQTHLENLRRVLLRFMSATALLVFPLLAGFMVLSKPIVLILLGEKWAFTSVMLVYGCPCGFFYLISTFNRNVYNATGRTDLAFYTEVIKKIIFVLIFLLTMKYNIRILLIGLIFISIVEMIIDTYMVKKQIGLTLIEEFKSLLGVSLATIFMSVIIYVVIILFDSNIIKLLMGGIVGAIFYIMVCLFFNVANFKIDLISYVRKCKK